MRPSRVVPLVLLAALAGGACFMSRDPAETSLRAEVQRYLDRYGPEYQRLSIAAQEAQQKIFNLFIIVLLRVCHVAWRN